MVAWIRELGPVFEAHHGRYFLPLMGVALVLLNYLGWSRASAERFGPGLLRVLRGMTWTLLAPTVVLAVLVWNNFFIHHYGSYLNAYEFFHHYLGTKYSDEVGYFDLYNAALAADAEMGRWYRADSSLTDLRTYQPLPVPTVLHDRQLYRARFSPERWQEWVQDVAYFKHRLGFVAWNRLLKDKGYNGTPVWTMVVGGLFTRHVPTTSETGMLLLALLDVGLLVSAFVAIGAAFGIRIALFAWIFLASSYLTAHVHMKGALLRTDFVVALVLATCALKVGRHGLAGALVACATLSRLFPVAFLFGPGAKLVWDVLLLRRATWPARFFFGFASTAGALVLGSLVYHGGPQAWTDFTRKIELHRSRPHHWNVGFDTLMVARLDAQVAEQQSRSWPIGTVRSWIDTPVLNEDAGRGRLGIELAVQVAILAICFLAARRLSDHRALAFGFVPAFFLVAPTYYYYITLLLPFLFFAERLERGRDALGVACLFLFGLAGFWCYYRWDQFFPTYFWISVLALPIVSHMILAAWLPERPSTGRMPFP